MYGDGCVLVVLDILCCKYLIELLFREQNLFIYLFFRLSYYYCQFFFFVVNSRFDEVEHEYLREYNLNVISIKMK